MADAIRIEGPIKIKSDGSPEKVAFDLMEKISNYDDGTKPKNEEYWLTLYRKCLRATLNRPPE
jgi:hypothetical protein